MKVRIAIGAVAVVAAITVWTVVASHLFVWMADLSDYFPSPRTTWWRYARHPHVDSSTALYLIASAILAAIPILVALAGVWGATRQNTRQPKVWGSSDFADRHEMDRGGIKTREKLF